VTNGAKSAHGVPAEAPAIPTNKLLLFLRAARAPFLTASVLPVLVGSTLPFWIRPEGFAFNLPLFIEALVGVVLVHMGANLSNGYYDHVSGADPSNPNPGVLSGGSGLITSGALPARFFLRSSIVCFVLGAAIGLHLNWLLPGNLVLVLGAIGILSAHFYTAPPLRFSYRGLGEIVVGLCFGVLPVVGAYFVQAELVSWNVLLASLPITFAVVLVLWVNEIADRKPDEAAGKRTLVVALGGRASARVAVTLLAILVFATLFAAVFTGSLIPLTLVAVLAFGLVRAVVVECWKYHELGGALRAGKLSQADAERLRRERDDAMAEAQVSTMKLHLAIGLIVAGSALVAIGN